jgi:hypothetical protein
VLCALCLLNFGLLQGAPKQKTNKKAAYLPTYLFLRFFEIFRSDFRKYFYGVFGLLMLRNGQKRDSFLSMGKDDRIFFSLNFFGQKFLTWISPQKVFNGVFELPLLRNAQKRHKKNHKKLKKKKKGPSRLPDLVAICQIDVAFNFFFFGAPCLLHTFFFSPCFFLSPSWAFRNKRSKKENAIKKIAEKNPQPPKKVVTPRGAP